MCVRIVQDDPKPARFANPRLLIVEGKDEEVFLSWFIRQMNRYQAEISGIDVWQRGGKHRLSASIKALQMTPGFDDQDNTVSSLGIVRDADEDASGAFQSVCHALREARLPVPERPMSPVGEHPRITVMIIPGIERTGMLEDLCLDSVREDPAMPCIEQYFECLSQALADQEIPKNSAKAWVQTYLASRKSSVRDLGIAAQKGYWGDWDHPAFEMIRSFLEVLCS